jgi:type I restriction enzyme M protein
MPAQTSQSEINAVVWKACDTFRGTIDPSQYKDYILVLLFLKFLSDLTREKRSEYERALQRRRRAGAARHGA